MNARVGLHRHSAEPPPLSASCIDSATLLSRAISSLISASDGAAGAA